ncbi:MAG: type IV toxin-antitoxin system AbiEi family antitoxin domain-containing protein [Solirubrobacterales bacterium]|nr:type IV toxin-antitoxin system AbiEi family antitoxin domain-containing protein [Solirubrobacterales bacterium]
MKVAGRAAGAKPPGVCVAEKAARQHGRIHVRQLAACGLDDAAIARRVKNGTLHRVHVGVYAVGHAGGSLHARFMAAVLAAGSGAVLSHWAAAVLWGLVRWDGRAVDVTAPGSGNRRRPGIRFHRTRSMTPDDMTRREGIRVVTAARALLEIAPQLSDRRLRRVVRQALAEELTSAGEIADVVARANGHRSAKRLAVVIAGPPAPTRSGHEDDVLDLVLAARLQPPDVNKPLVVGGSTYRPDMRWPVQRLILEVDSVWHDDPVAQACDAERQADLEASGERVLRTTREQACSHPSQLVARLAAAGVPRVVGEQVVGSNSKGFGLATQERHEEEVEAA